jgi:hypothetical protein
MWERPQVSEIFLNGMSRLNIPVLSAVSDIRSRALCKLYETDYIETANFPLGEKWNTIATASLDYDWTHMVLAGDDDLFTNEFIELAEQYRDLPFTGLRGMIMIEPRTHTAIKFRYEKPVAIGTGRVFQREVIERLYKMDTVMLFDPDLNSRLDYSSDMRLFEKGYQPVFLDDLSDVMCVGIKTERNIWPIGKFRQQSVTVDYEKAINMLSKNEQELVCRL